MSDWLMKCNYCQTYSPELRRCTKCYIVYYCTRACQSQDWPEHRKACSTPTLHKPDTHRTQGQHNDIADLSSGVKAMKTESSKPRSKQLSGLYDTPDTKDKIYEARTDDVNVTEDETDINAEDEADSIGVTRNVAECAKTDRTTEYVPGQCRVCKIQSCTLTCARCKTAFYCSKKCQKTDWPSHKRTCTKVKEDNMYKKESELTENEKRMKTRVEQVNSAKRGFEKNSQKTVWFNCHGIIDNVDVNLTADHMRIYQRPEGSLQRAIHFAQVHFPGWSIVKSFDEIPSETLLQLMKGQKKPHRANLLVAFMFMRHEHVIRHGVYLKDSKDEITCVQFYLYMDNPLPYFTYDQVRPGHYILIKNPIWHQYMDGQVGLKVEDPAEVKVCEI